jgi:hypothetical protein
MGKLFEESCVIYPKQYFQTPSMLEPNQAAVQEIP